MALALGIAVGGPVWIWQIGLAGAAVEIGRTGATIAAAEIGLRVRQVLVEGRRETPIKVIRAAVPVRRGQPILTVDPHELRKQLLKIGWIREVTVERRLPDIIHLRIEERQPIAIWQSRHRLVLIDETGAVIGVNGLSRYRDLPLVVGDGAAEHAKALIDLVRSEPALQGRVVAAVRVGGRRWNIQMQGGVEIRLPEEDAANAWTRLATMEREHRLLARDIAVVDMRMGDRLVVRIAPDAAERARRPSKST